LLCEKVGNIPDIGNVHTGLNAERIRKIYVEDFIAEATQHCKNCWAINLCFQCYVNCYDEQGTHFDYRHRSCMSERSIELLFSKKDLKNTDHRMAFNRILSTEMLLSDFGRTLLNTALKISSADAEKWYIKGKDKFNSELPSRIVNNLACCYARLRLLERVCDGVSLAFDTVFPFSMDHCIKYMEFAAKDYLLDGGTNNRSIVEQTFEIMSRMKLDPKVYYKIDDGRLYLWLTPVYDLYTKYRKDYAIVGEVLTYAQFKKQLQHSEYFIASNEQKRIGTENRKCWVIDYMLLGKNCDISGFEVTEIEPLTM